MSTTSRCKRGVKIVVDCCNTLVEASGFIHPKKCMKARQNHLDIVFRNALEKPAGFLLELSKRGIKLNCAEWGDCIVAYLKEIGEQAVICIEGWIAECKNELIFIKKTKKETVYLTGVRLTRKEDREKRGGLNRG